MAFGQMSLQSQSSSLRSILRVMICLPIQGECLFIVNSTESTTKTRTTRSEIYSFLRELHSFKMLSRNPLSIFFLFLIHSNLPRRAFKIPTNKMTSRLSCNSFRFGASTFESIHFPVLCPKLNTPTVFQLRWKESISTIVNTCFMHLRFRKTGSWMEFCRWSRESARKRRRLMGMMH
jgi:hypothetical protein